MNQVYLPEPLNALGGVAKGELRCGVPLHRYTSLKVGGPAAVMIYPSGITDLQNIIRYTTAHAIPYFIMGRGTNLLIRDGGIAGVVLNLSRGFKKIVLLGQNVNSYGKDLKPPRKFSELLRVLHQIKNVGKISFLTSNPWDLTDDIIEVMSLPKIDRYLHLPVQSGDNEVLRRMNRPYTAKQYLALIRKIRQRIPDIKIGTDIIVGFPGETEKAFENTVELCKKAGFFKAYIAKYSPRPGTAAFRLKDDVSPEEKKRRWRNLEKLINKK